jgi:hypothetical protein
MLIERFWLIGGPMAGKEKTLFLRIGRWWLPRNTQETRKPKANP